MSFDALVSQCSAYLSSVTGSFGDLTTLWKAGEEYIYGQFGTQGVIAAYIVSGAVGIAVITKLVRLALAALMYLVIPSIALAWIGSLLLPYSFMFLLPIVAAGCSLLFLLKA